MRAYNIILLQVEGGKISVLGMQQSHPFLQISPKRKHGCTGNSPSLWSKTVSDTKQQAWVVPPALVLCSSSDLHDTHIRVSVTELLFESGNVSKLLELADFLEQCGIVEAACTTSVTCILSNRRVNFSQLHFSPQQDLLEITKPPFPLHQVSWGNGHCP